MNKKDMIYFGRYEGWLRHLAKGVKARDAQCIRKAARLFDVMLPDDAVVVPMPSHTGIADYMIDIAFATGRRVYNVLSSEPRESSYQMKKDGEFPSVRFNVTLGLYNPDIDTIGRTLTPVYVIDNVICTGVTADAAVGALKMVGVDAKVCAIAYSQWKG